MWKTTNIRELYYDLNEKREGRMIRQFKKKLTANRVMVRLERSTSSIKVHIKSFNSIMTEIFQVSG